MDIDIGSPAIVRAQSASGQTMILKDNPSNGAGEITSIEIYSWNELTDVVVATFYVVVGNYLSTRDYHTIGTVSGGSKQTFPGLELTVEAGDYIGIYFYVGSIYRDVSVPAGVWYRSGNNIPCDNIIFSAVPNYTLSLYGEGGPPPVIIKDSARTGIYIFKTLK